MSPVIGVILMVAITVILAAVIAAFVFGMGSTLKKTYVVAATATQINQTAIDITYTGGPDYASVSKISYSVAGNTPYYNTTALVVGLTRTDMNGTTGRDHVIVVAEFVDGASQVILDTFV